MALSAVLIGRRIFFINCTVLSAGAFRFYPKNVKNVESFAGPNSVSRDRVAQLSLYRTLCGKITVEKVLWPREMRRYGRLRDKVNEVWRFCNATATRCTFVSASIAGYFYIE